jgi:hypothetical protein
MLLMIGPTETAGRRCTHAFADHGWLNSTKTTHDVLAGARLPEQHFDCIITDSAPLVPSRLPLWLDQLFQIPSNSRFAPVHLSGVLAEIVK